MLSSNKRMVKESNGIILQCTPWGSNGGHSELGNPYQAIQVDILYQLDIGIFEILVFCFREMVDE